MAIHKKGLAHWEGDLKSGKGTVSTESGALSQQPYGWLVQQDGASAVIADLVAECQAVAQADGVRMDGDVHAAVRGIAQSMPGQLSSTAQDLARGRPSEIEHLNGYVVRRGAALGAQARGIRQPRGLRCRACASARARGPWPPRRSHPSSQQRREKPLHPALRLRVSAFTTP